MELDTQRTRMQQHIQDQALFQGKRVRASFLRQDGDEEIFSVRGSKGAAELRLDRSALSMTPTQLWQLDERIAEVLASV